MNKIRSHVPITSIERAALSHLLEERNSVRSNYRDIANNNLIASSEIEIALRNTKNMHTLWYMYLILLLGKKSFVTDSCDGRVFQICKFMGRSYAVGITRNTEET